MQLYSLRNEFMRDGMRTFSTIAAAGFDCIEAVMLAGVTVSKLKETADRCGLSIRGLHGPIPPREEIDDFARIVAARCRKLGCSDFIGIRHEHHGQGDHLLGDFVSDAREFGLRLARDFGVTLHVHPYPSDYDNARYEDAVLKLDNVIGSLIEPDIKHMWNAYRSADKLESVLERTMRGGHVSILHLNNVSASGECVPLPDGVVQYEAILNVIRVAANPPTLIVEPDTEDPVTSAVKSLMYLQQSLA
ncbi:MAG: sugar phosphate isomerase/epimerase [Planctomycetes bacterium]|nr:sugar phosphate isomerase/epimerase [Planctomycetota bacterium]